MKFKTVWEAVMRFKMHYNMENSKIFLSFSHMHQDLVKLLTTINTLKVPPFWEHISSVYIIYWCSSFSHLNLFITFWILHIGSREKSRKAVGFSTLHMCFIFFLNIQCIILCILIFKIIKLKTTINVDKSNISKCYWRAY